MPFDQFFPRTFSVASVREHAPARSGVYGISNAREWILINETDNIQAALLHHLSEADPGFRQRLPTGFVFEVCDHARRQDRRQRLVREYEPAYNRQEPLPRRPADYGVDG